MEIHDRLPVSAQETAMLLGGVELDVSTEVRSVIECVLHDNLQPAIRDLTVAASYRPNPQLYEGVSLADAVSHLARAQALLAEELDGLSDASKQEEASPEVAPGGEGERSTSPIDSL